MIARAFPLGLLWLLAAWGCGLGAGCLRESSQRCGNGGVCPPGLLCVDTEETTSGGRICAASTCGNGRLELDERCDDSNNRSGDGCPADCMEPCGDGVVDPGERCDDGNTVDGAGPGDGCAADCKALNGDLAVSPAQVSFQAAEGAALPAAVSVNVRLEYPGDTVLIGFAPGAPPSWLSIEEHAATERSAQLELRVTDTAVTGRRSTSVRLLISHEGSAGLETFDLPVTYDVLPSDLALTATPAALTFSTTVGEPVSAQLLELVFNGEPLALLAAPPWLTVSPPSSATSPATLEISINDRSFPAGSELTGQLVFRTTRGQVERTLAVPISYRVRAPVGLVVEAAPTAVTFIAAAGGRLPPPRSVLATFTGESVEVRSAPSWLTVAAPSDPTASPAVFSLAVNTTAFPPGSVQSGSLILRTRSGASWSEAAVVIQYELRSDPEVEYVAPYVGLAGRGGMVRLRGRHFPTTRMVTLRLGDLVLGPVQPESATQITVAVPPLPAGRYPVTLLDPPGSPYAPELVIVAPPPFGYQALDAPGQRRRLLYDAERQALYAVNELAHQIDHFAYLGGSWTAVAPHPVPQLKDLVMSPDGRSLFIVEQNAISEMSLTDGLFAPILRAARPVTDRQDYFTEAAVANSGKLLLVSGDGFFAPLWSYDPRDHSLSAGEQRDLSTCASSADGSRIYLAGDNFDPLGFYDARTDSLSFSSTIVDVYRLSVSGDGGRLILSDSGVYDAAFTLLGHVPYELPYASLISRDGGRAFVYAQRWLGPQLNIYDLNAPPNGDGAFPLLRSIPLPDPADRDDQWSSISMAATPDDSVVFVLGALKLLIIPVD